MFDGLSTHGLLGLLSIAVILTRALEFCLSTFGWVIRLGEDM